MEKLSAKSDKQNGTLIQRLPDTPAHMESYKTVSLLDFSSANYRLLDLERLDDEKYRTVYKNITLLDFSKNSVTALKLKGYKQLETIRGWDNNLTGVELSLPRLRILDLSDNMISKLFELNSLPFLEELILNKNAIRNIYFEDLRSVKNSLRNLELAQNRIEFKTVKDFFELFESLGKYMKKLNVLNIGNNTFNSQQSKTYKEYAEFIIANCTSLKTFNGKLFDNSLRNEIQVNQIKNRMQDLEKQSGLQGIKSVNINQDSTHQKDIKLEDLTKEVEMYSQQGKLNKNSFRDFRKLVDIYFENSHSSREEDSMKIEDTEQGDFETFLEYCSILTDSNPTIEGALTKIVAQFVIIKNGKFASRALSFLEQRLSPEKAKEVAEIIGENILKSLTEKSEDKVSSTIILGLVPFLRLHHFVPTFRPLLTRLINLCLELSKIELVHTKSSEQNRKKELYFSIVTFLATASNNGEHLNTIVDSTSLMDHLSSRLKDLLSDGEVVSHDIKAMEILQQTLDLVRSLCTNLTDEEFQKKANLPKLVGGGIKDKLEQSINSQLGDISNRGRQNKGQNSTKDLLYKRMATFAFMIRCYGAILLRSDSVSKLVDNSQSVPMKIINFLNQNEMSDPLLISAATDFTFLFLNNKAMLANANGIFTRTTKSLYNLKFLLPYLFYRDNQFINACLKAADYGQNTIVRGLPLELTKMNSEIINDLIISIAQLIEFFGKHSKKDSKISEVCREVCGELNGQGRDSALCEYLSIDNDRVKLALVKCLYSTDCSELESGEIFQIWRQLKNINPTGETIAQIVSYIVIILNRSFLYYMNQGMPEVIEQNKDALSLAFELINKNEERNGLQGEDNKQKAVLSIIIATFLFNCSCFGGMDAIFLDQRNADKVYRILKFEEIVPESSVFPVEIEKTRAGCHFLNLVPCFKDTLSLRPYTYVSLRILIHIADVLMQVPYTIYDINLTADYEEVVETLKSEIIERERRRISSEKSSFRTFLENINRESDTLRMHFSEEEIVEQQQREYLKHFPDLFRFVLGEANPDNISEFTDYFKDKFDPQIEKIKFSSEFTLGLREEDEDIILNKEGATIKEIFLSHLRGEEFSRSSEHQEVINDYDYNTTDLIKYDSYGMEKDLTRIKEEESPNNPYMRSLFVCAFLRSIFAILECSSDRRVKEKLIKIIYADNNIILLSKLVDCTKFLENNAVSKYLMIMRHVIMNSGVFFERADASVDKYLTILGVFSYLIKKIVVRVFKKELKLEDDDHKLLLAEISRMYIIIINELQSLELKQHVREDLMEVMVGYEVMTVFIDMVKKHMNNDADLFKKKEGEKDYPNDAVLNEMIANMSYIIGEYMSRCKNYKYRILEAFTKSYIFDGVKMRKTYLRDMLQYSKHSDLKSVISNTIKIKVDFLTRVFLVDCATRKTHIKLLIVTNLGIKFIDVDKEEDENSDLGMKKFHVDENLSILFEDIEAVLSFDILNRIFVKTVNNNHLGMFFYKNHITSLLLPLIKSNNSSIKFFDRIQTLAEEAERSYHLFEITEQNKATETDRMALTPDSPDKSHIPEIKIIPVSAKKQNYTVIVCKSEVKKFLDFITKMFKKTSLIKNQKVLVIKGDKLSVYEEDFEQWLKMDAKMIFSAALKKHPQGCSDTLYLHDFSDCYKLLLDHDLKCLEKFVTKNVDSVHMRFSTGEEFNCNVLDDLSYVKLKIGLFSILRAQNASVKDDYYDDIK